MQTFICICENLYLYCICANLYLYLCKLVFVFVQTCICICANLHLCKLLFVFVQFCICIFLSMEICLEQRKLFFASFYIFNEPSRSIMQCQLAPRFVETEQNKNRTKVWGELFLFEICVCQWFWGRWSFPQNVVGAILVPIFLWSIGAAGEKAEYVRKMAKVCLNLIRISGQRHSSKILENQKYTNENTKIHKWKYKNTQMKIQKFATISSWYLVRNRAGRICIWLK